MALFLHLLWRSYSNLLTHPVPLNFWYWKSPMYLCKVFMVEGRKINIFLCSMEIKYLWDNLCCCSVTKLCPTVCDYMDYSTPGFLFLHYLPEFAQTPVYCVNDAIQPTHPVTFFYSCPQCFPASGSFPVNQLFTSGGQNIRASASSSVLPMNMLGKFRSYSFVHMLRQTVRRTVQFTLTRCNPMDCSMLASLSITNAWSLLKLMCIKLVMSSNDLILCHPLLLSPQSFPASGSFQMSQLFASGGQSIGVLISTSVLPMNIQDWSPLGWTGWISLPSKGLSRVFSNTTVQKHWFLGTQLSL